MDVGGIEFKRFGELSAPCKPPYSCRSENGKGEIVKQGGLQADEQNGGFGSLCDKGLA